MNQKQRLRKAILFLLLLASSAFPVVAQRASDEVKKPLYSGGMLFFQPGYAMAENSFQTIRHNSWGVGGIVRFYFGDYLTAGLHGGSQYTSYRSVHSDNSYINMGYGGAFLGFSRRHGRFRYSASGFVGMGAVDNLHIQEQEGASLKEAYLHKHATLVVSPIISVDYSIASRLSLTAQLVYLTAKANANSLLQNPVLQVGILFSR